MLVVDSPVEAHAELIVEVRTGSDATEGSEVRRQQGRGNDASLLIALPASKKEHAVSTDRAAKAESKLAPLEEGVRIGGVALERRIRGEFVIAKEVKDCAVKIVGSGASDDVDRAGRSNPRRKIEVRRR